LFCYCQFCSSCNGVKQSSATSLMRGTPLFSSRNEWLAICANVI
jgi:hypothetical protein